MEIKLNACDVAYQKNLEAMDRRLRGEHQRQKAMDRVLTPKWARFETDMPTCLNEYRQRQTLTDWLGR